MIEKNWNPKWDEINEYAMDYEVAVIPFLEEDYLEEFYQFYHVQDRTASLIS